MDIRVAARSTALAALLAPLLAVGHGSVTNEDDLCAIDIGYLRAHFKIYLARDYEHEDFCEDLPAAGESTFVMEYIHSGLGDLPLDFRIIRNETGMGRFTQLQHVTELPDLAAVTEFYLPAASHPDVFTVMHRFTEPGEYVGIVTVNDGRSDKVYRAVFPFEVGFAGFGYWPWIAAILIVLQLQYLHMSGRLSFGRRRIGNAPALAGRTVGRQG